MTEIYKPAEDSSFFSIYLKKTIKNTKLKYLDLGCGSCILADTLKEIGIKDITCSDININATYLAKKKGFKTIHSDLFEEINEKFDLITFNAPYLPFDSREPKESQIATTGGKKGDEISIKFLKQAKNHLNKDGKILLLISSLTPFKKIKDFNPKIVAKKKIFFEELIILEFI